MSGPRWSAATTEIDAARDRVVVTVVVDSPRQVHRAAAVLRRDTGCRATVLRADGTSGAIACGSDEQLLVLRDRLAARLAEG